MIDIGFGLTGGPTGGHTDTAAADRLFPICSSAAVPATMAVSR
jgi:hypothetical protein